jgi:hypothetical protein
MWFSLTSSRFSAMMITHKTISIANLISTPIAIWGLANFLGHTSVLNYARYYLELNTIAGNSVLALCVRYRTGASVPHVISDETPLVRLAAAE